MHQVKLINQRKDVNHRNIYCEMIEEHISRRVID